MMLHIGHNRIVAQKEIIAILPCAQAPGYKSCILLADGTKLYSPIASTTLKRRLEAFALEKPRIRNRSKRQRNSISP